MGRMGSVTYAKSVGVSEREIEIHTAFKKLPRNYQETTGGIYRISMGMCGVLEDKRVEWEKATYPSSLVSSPPPVHFNLYIPHVWACELLPATPRVILRWLVASLVLLVPWIPRALAPMLLTRLAKVRVAREHAGDRVPEDGEHGARP